MNKVQFISSLFQNTPSFRGKRRLCRAVAKGLGILKNKNIFLRTKSGVFELPNLIEIISFDLFVFGAYEKGLVQLLIKNVPPNGVFIDIGANIGSISIPLALARPDIKIIAVEASPWIYNLLKRNINANDLNNIIAENYAVYSESGKQLPMYAPKELFGKGSLKPVYTGEGEIVSTITIDDLKKIFNLLKIDFIKVDVEGFEADVFKGMNSSIASEEKPKIIFEFSEWAEKAAGFEVGEAQSILLSKGYKLQGLDENFNIKVYRSDNKEHSLRDANLFAE